VYRHEQRSRVAPLVNGALAVLLLGIGWTDPVGLALMLPVAVLLAWIGWHFRRLTVEVSGGELRAWFGGGWPRYAWPLARIDTVRAVANPWWYGIGIRFTPRGMLYNVASGPGIEFRLKSGATFRLGSDEPEALADAIRSAAAETGTPETRTNALTH
jgi:hypothetical protein